MCAVSNYTEVSLNNRLRFQKLSGLGARLNKTLVSHIFRKWYKLERNTQYFTKFEKIGLEN